MQPLMDGVRRLEQTAGDGTPDLEAVMRAYMRMVTAQPLVSRADHPRGAGPERADAGWSSSSGSRRRQRRRWSQCCGANANRKPVPASTPRFAAVSLLSSVSSRSSIADHQGPVLGFQPEGVDLDRFISHTAQLFREGVAARGALDVT